MVSGSASGACEQLTSEAYKNLEDLHEHTTKLFQLKVDREALISKSMAGEISINTFIYSPFSSLLGSLRLLFAVLYELTPLYATNALEIVQKLIGS